MVKLVIHSKLAEKMKRKEERKLLNQIQNLAPELITIIYHFLTEKVKYIYNIKYNFLEEKIRIKEDSKNGFVYWNFLRNKFELINNSKLLIYINSIIIPIYPLIINNIWYSSKENNKFFKGLELINLWKNNNIDKNYYNESREIFNNIMKYRFIDAIYYYLLRKVNTYEINKIKNVKTIYFNNITSTNNISSNNLQDIKKIHFLCRSLT